MGNDLRILKSKASLHEKLLQLMQTKAINEIKVTELCQLANVSRGTFYAHYSQVEDVMSEKFLIVMKALEQSYINPYKKGYRFNTPILDPDTIMIFDHVKKHEAFYRIILSEQSSLKYYYKFYETLSKILSNPAYIEVEQDKYNTVYSTNGIIALIIEWYKNDFQDSVQDMNVRLFKVLLENRKI